MPLNTVETEKLKLYVSVEDTMGIFNGTMRSRLVNSYSDYNRTVNTVARSVIGNDRMQAEGTVTSYEHKAGWNQDLTQYNTQDIFPASLFSNMVETPKTHPIYGTETPITSMTTTTLVASGGGLTKFGVGELVWCSGFDTTGNNGEKRITGVTSTALTFASGTFVDENLSGKKIKVERIGRQFAEGDVTLEYTSGSPTGTLTCDTSGTIFADLGIVRGMILILDANSDDYVINSSADRGFIRVRSVSTVGGNSVITFDLTSFAPVTSTASTKQVRIYWGDFVKNSVGSGIVDKTLSTLRVTPVSTGDEYDIKRGCGIDEVTINIPKPEADAKVDIDIACMAMATSLYGGATTKPTTALSTLDEGACYATAKELMASKLYKRTGATTPFPVSQSAYASDGTISIKNNVSIPTAWGSPDGFDVNKGGLEVSGSLNIYYKDLTVEQSIGNKDMFGLYTFFGRANGTGTAEGIFFDIPYMQCQTGGKTVEKDGVIMLPIDFTAVKDDNILNVFSVSYFNFMPRHLLTELGVE